MGNVINLPNINPDSIVLVDDAPVQEAKKESSFNTKNYLNTRLAEGETEKTITIRLLPMNLETGSPFVKVHVHNVKVPEALATNPKKPYKTYICLAKTADIDHEKFGTKCPYCEINRKAYLESTKVTDPTEKKKLQDISLDNLAREAVIVRCIERGHEDEGVKFWKFNLRGDKTDPYNQIVKLYNLRKEAAERKGKSENILDIYEGRDLNITFTADGTSAPTIVDDSDRSPLSENAELMQSWIYDSKKWQEVFTAKTYEYLALVAQMKEPWFDKANNVWIDRAEYEASHKVDNDKSVSASEDAKNNLLSEPSVDVPVAKNDDFVASISLDNSGDDLPF